MALTLWIKFIEAIDQHKSLSIIERLLNESRQAPQVKHGGMFTRRIDDELAGSFDESNGNCRSAT